MYCRKHACPFCHKPFSKKDSEALKFQRSQMNECIHCNTTETYCDNCLKKVAKYAKQDTFETSCGHHFHAHCLFIWKVR